jgi:hypothetical protein
MIGIAPLADRPADFDPVPVRQHEVEDRRVGVLDRSGIERLLGGRRRNHVEIGIAEDDLQCAEDLQLVVADEHAPAGGHSAARSAAGAAAGFSAGIGTWMTKLVP